MDFACFLPGREYIILAYIGIKMTPSDSGKGVAMTAITITLPDDSLLKLKEIAANLGVSPEELVRASIEELLTRPEEDFKQAVDHVLEKNAELYRRLA
ncbi:MAG: ribbon-helix-helix protein, CopG family [bacterium]